MSWKDDILKMPGMKNWNGKLYKVLQGNKSCHGGDFEWSLPKIDKPGDWTPVIENVKMCERGYHLTTHYAHWSDEEDISVYEAEGDVVEFDNYDKVVCTRARLLKLVENPFDGYTEKIWKYGLLPPSGESREAIENQMNLSHNHYNAIIAQEREKRIQEYNAMSANPDIEMLEAWISKIKDEIKIAQENKKKTKLKSEIQELENIISGLCNDLEDLCPILKEAKSKFSNSVEYKEKMENIKSTYKEKYREELYHKNDKLFWGSKNIQKRYADVASKQARKNKNLPSFRRNNKPRIIGIQVQENGGIDNIRKCTYVQVDIPEKWEKRCSVKARIRIGSTGKGNRIPIWAELEMIMHRPFPDKCEIKWVQVIKKIIAGKEKWDILFTLRTPIEKNNNSNKAIALDIGWRKIGDEIRYGYMWDGENSKELRLPAKLISAFEKVESLQSTRDKMFNKMKDDGILKELKEKAPKDWFGKYCKYLHLSESKKTWSTFVKKWRNDRWDGDDELFRKFEEWRKQERHLWLWQENFRNKTIAARDDLYKNIAASLAKEYGLLIIEDFDLSEISVDGYAGGQRTIVALHKLRDALVNVFVGCGSTVIKIDPKNTTKKCNVCKSVEKWEKPGEVKHTCTCCGATWDRDKNAAKNIYDIWADRDQSSGNAVKEIINICNNKKEPKWGKRGRHNKKT